MKGDLEYCVFQRCHYNAGAAGLSPDAKVHAAGLGPNEVTGVEFFVVNAEFAVEER